MCSWFGRAFYRTKKLDYWKSKIKTECLDDPTHNCIPFDYAGTGGCSVDARVFLIDTIFKCPKKFRCVEDLWLSFIIRKICDRPLIRTYIPPLLDMFKDTESTALYSTIKPLKTEFLELCSRFGYLDDNPINMSELEAILEEDDSDSLIANLKSPI